MRQPRIRLTDQDRSVWSSYVADFRKLPGRAAAPPLPTAPPPEALPQAAITPARPPAKHTALPMLIIGRAPAGLDAGTWRRLADGGMKPGRRLDLHGLTVQNAFDRFAAVVPLTSAAGVRCLEVITGRGSGEAGGVLRRELPLWLNRPDLRPLILAAAHPHRRNDGSVLLLLRRRPR